MTDRPATDPLDIAARDAFRYACKRLGGTETFARTQGIGLRTVERMYARKRAVPPGLARALVDKLAGAHRDEQERSHRDALMRWADACDAQREGQADG